MKKKRLILIMLILSLIAGTIPVSANGEIKQLKDLPTGSIVYDPSWTWEHKTESAYTGGGTNKAVEWVIVAKNHTSYPANSVTLLSNELIARYAFDDRYNTDYSENYGYNHWGDSNKIRPFLNTSFFNTFSNDFKNSVLETTLNMKTHTGSTYTSKDKVFLPSENELGGNYTTSDGNSWGYFSSDSSRIANLNGNTLYYWTRSPDSGGSNLVRLVSTDGSFGYYSSLADYSGYGVRPALNLKSDTLVKSVGSKWEIVYNSPPTLNITNPNNAQTIGSSGKITMSGSILDSDNDGVTISATIGGKLKSTTVTNTSTTKPWTLEWLGSELDDGTYNNTLITAKDDKGNTTTKTYTGTILVDKTNPIITIEPYNEDWTNKDIIVVATVNKGILNKTSHTFTENGSFTFIATDEYGNQSTKTVTITNIDKVKPKFKIIIES